MEEKKLISADLLKWIALITMMIDHIGAGILEKCYMPDLYEIDSIIRGIGRIAFPIYCFLVVEGYRYTRSRWKYAMNLLVFAIISEVPFDFLFRNGINFGYQNVYFTLLFGLLVMMAAGKIEEMKWRFGILLEIIICIGIALVAEFMHTDYNSWGVILIFILFIYRNKPRWMMCLAGAIFMLTNSSEIPAIISFVLIFFYSGERKGAINKYVFYSLYPIHLALYYGLRCILMM